MQRALRAFEPGAHDAACGSTRRSGKKKRLLNLQKGDKLHARMLHARMLKKNAENKMQEEGEQ